MSTAAHERTNDSQKAVHGLASATGKPAERTATLGRYFIRHGFALVLLWIGGMQFIVYEAEANSGFVSFGPLPLMLWDCQLFGKWHFSVIPGITERLTGAPVAVRPLSPGLSAVGSVLALGTFLTTPTFLLAPPGVIEPSLGFPALSPLPAQRHIKDVVLLGAAPWTMGKAIRAVR